MTPPLLTIGMAVYGQPLMLAEWFRRFELAASPAQREHLEVIVVDDCGTPPVDKAPLRARVLRITEDTPWNQPEARNLAAREAAGTVLLMIDPDMTLPEDSLAGFLAAAKALRRGHVVRPVLRHGNGAIDATSPNVYLVHREDFLASKGYDLAYCGHKGWSDVTMSQVWSRLFTVRTNRNLVLDFHHEGLFADAQVKTLDRSVAYNKKIHLQHKQRIAKLGVKGFLGEHSPMVMSPWTEVR